MATAEVYCISINELMSQTGWIKEIAKLFAHSSDPMSQKNAHSVGLGSSYPVPVIFDRGLYTYPHTLPKLTDNKSNIDKPTHLLINNW
jgi:hypothetical protein